MSDSELAKINPNEIVIPEVKGSIPQDEAALKELAKAGNWLARMQLLQFSAKLVKTSKASRGGILVAIYDKDTLEELTSPTAPNLEVIVYGWRAKALKLEGLKPVQSSYDFDSPEFKELQALEPRLPKDGPTLVMWGPEFLFWVPKAKNGAGAFLTFFCSSKTARREADNIRSFVGKAALLQVKYIDSGTYQWHGPKILPCTSVVRLPSESDLTTALGLFKNPPKDAKELAEAEAGIEQ